MLKIWPMETMIVTTSGAGRRTACSKHCVRSRSRDCEIGVGGHEHPGMGDGEESSEERNACIVRVV